MKNFLSAVILILMIPAFSRAQVHYHSTGSAVPSQLKKGGQYFDFTSSGLIDYLDQLEQSDPKLAGALRQDIKDLRFNDLLGKTLLWGGTVGTIVCLSTCLLFNDYSDGEISYLPMLLITGVSLVSVFSSFFISPSRKDYLKIINKNNSLRPDSPLELNLGYIPPSKKVKYGMLSFQLNF